MTATPDVDLARLYRDTRERLSDLLIGLDGDQLSAPVPATPGWSVSDVVRHLLAVAEDVMAGRLTRPPSDDETAAQVARHGDTAVPVLVETWAALAPQFEQLVGAARVWPAVLDVATHEQDIRGALDRPGARESDVVRIGSERLLNLLQPPCPLHVACEDIEIRVGPEGTSGPELLLRTTRFDAFRWRMGRRSPEQLRALDWSSDPGPVIDDLCIFGPAVADVVE